MVSLEVLAVVPFINSLTYKVGEKTLMYLRYHFLQKGHSVKDFHKLVLDVGPCPLDILVEYFLENELI